MSYSYVFNSSNPQQNLYLFDIIGPDPLPDRGLIAFYNVDDPVQSVQAELAIAATTSSAGDYMAGSIALAGAQENIPNLGGGGLLVGIDAEPFSEPLTVTDGEVGYVLTITQKDPTGVIAWRPSPAAATWTVVSGTTQTIAFPGAYIATNVALTTFTIPTTASVGDTFKISNYGTGGWRLNVGTVNQTLRIGSSEATTGTGYLASTATGDSLEVVCMAAPSAGNEVFVVVNSMGNITVV